jgi:hypothetical protein
LNSKVIPKALLRDLKPYYRATWLDSDRWAEGINHHRTESDVTEHFGAMIHFVERTGLGERMY